MKPYCWWCCHSFEWESLNFPYMFTGNTFYTTGHFCSWSCMKAYAMDKQKYNTCEFITLMRKRVEGKVISTIPAPKRESLKIFGGTLDIDEFRRDPPLQMRVKIPGNFYFTEHTVDHVVTNAINGGGDGVLKLKREKPLERSKSKLETSLGIIRKKKCTEDVAVVKGS